MSSVRVFILIDTIRGGARKKKKNLGWANCKKINID